MSQPAQRELREEEPALAPSLVISIAIVSGVLFHVKHTPQEILLDILCGVVVIGAIGWIISRGEDGR